MRAILGILLSVILVDNYVLVKFLGICPFLGVSQKTKTALGMGTAVTFVMVVASAVTWPIQHYLLERFHVEYLQTIVFILVIASLVQLIEITLKKFIPALHKALGIYLPLITTNCAVLAVSILNIDNGYTFVQSLVNGLGAGLGFVLAMFMFSGVRERMESCNIPKALRGLPITLIAASLVSLSFFGFTGLVEGLLGK